MHVAAPDRYRMFHVDAFTRVPLEGNSAGVVVDGRGLSSAQMQSVARELRHSETAFVLPPDADDHDVRIRFFTPACEVPDCGHATVAAHHVLHWMGVRPAGPLRQKTGIGVRVVEIVRVRDARRVVIHQAPPTFGPELSARESADLARAIGLPVDVLPQEAPPRVVSTGRPKLLVPVPDATVLERLAPDMAFIERVCRFHECSGMVVFAALAAVVSGAAEMESRHFAPLIGVPEDPVTGNANGPIGAYAVRHRLVDLTGPVCRIRGQQGRFVGRPGVVDIEVDHDEGSPIAVRVGGEAVVLFDAVLPRRLFDAPRACCGA